MLIIHWIEIAFAVAGLVAAVMALLNSNWHAAAKIFGSLVAAIIGITFIGLLSTGIVTQDHAALVLVFGLVGSVILAGLAIRRWNTGWRPWAIGAGLLIVIAAMVLTFSGARPVSIPTPPAGGGSSVSAPASATSTSPRSSRGPRLKLRRPINCDNVSPDFKESAGCPE